MSNSTSHRSHRQLIPGFDDELPKLKAHFFYSSPLPIDDPLSAVPNTSGAEFNYMKFPLRPFSSVDSEALEIAWQDLISNNFETLPKIGEDLTLIPRNLQSNSWGTESVKKSDYTPENESSEQDNLIHAYFTDQTKHKIISNNKKNSLKEQKSENFTTSKSQASISTIQSIRFFGNDGMDKSSEKNLLDSNEIKKSRNSASLIDCTDVFHFDAHLNGKKIDVTKDENDENITCSHNRNEIEHKNSYMYNELDTADMEISGDCIKGGKDTIDQISISDQDSVCHNPVEKLNDVSENDNNDPRVLPDHDYFRSTKCYRSSLSKMNEVLSANVRTTSCASLAYTFKKDDTGTTGKPFVKLPTRPCSPVECIQNVYKDEPVHNKNQARVNNAYRLSAHKIETVSIEQSETAEPSKMEVDDDNEYSCEVPVGISRLHLVRLPNLQMKPIYWLPVNDMGSVTRGTWFYRDTMYPVESAVANQLEFGYRELKPWSQTWKDELESALSVGAAGEEKIAYRLWPSDRQKFPNKEYEQLRLKLSSNPYSAARLFHGDIAAEGSVNPEIKDQNYPEPKTNFKKFPTAKIIYKDMCHAFILKPNLQPSAYYGRRPLQKISKGMTVGIPVVRGFNWATWEKLHPTKNTGALKYESNATISRDDSLPKLSGSSLTAPKTYVQATDLVLVVHGIGQKLSERVESFNFTHAVNEFRRSMNIEMCNSSVRRVLRKDGFGIMVLPVNWRTNLSFEDGGLKKDDEHLKMDYSLRDVTQDSLPAVRQMITDVMLDIPYYMSKHKPKMIQAVIQEANRIYRLWCKNNRDFEKKGRVHLIAHSLGSVMVLEILSKQPTLVPKLDLDSKKINSEYFEFKTTNCFFAGSPAGFFLILEQARLSPRRGLKKPDAENSNDKIVTNEAGTFGCMALDNIYNVMHYNDPIAYRLNATVDRKYAESLKEAQLPTTSIGLFGNIGRAIRSITPGIIIPVQEILEEAKEPLNPLSTAHLPSNMEMEVHDFNREKIAEMKFNLLNDNGQIDWYMNSGRGPLEIQYINMLGAHSSYWINSDFVRLVVVECGRNPGKSNTLSSMRAVKLTRFGKQR
ncbi:putative phospholipase [Erysiphe neolycopersici]|uniref:Putative phospholipase n=1 Tax=Erysiphe neolycopersici TaxID=212602 RepID=A0A420HIG8_9PEZI|nr:putative phospholipase [Erysiphe neolycopersici]